MNSLKEDFLKALRDAIHRNGSQTKLAAVAGMQQSRISDYLSARYELDNITVGTLKKIFPEIHISYFPREENMELSTDVELEKQVIMHFRSLSPTDKARYAMLVAAHFPSWVIATNK